MRKKVVAVSSTVFVLCLAAFVYKLRDASPFFMFSKSLVNHETAELINKLSPAKVKITCSDAIWLFASHNSVISERLSKMNQYTDVSLKERGSLYNKISAQDNNKTQLEIDKWYFDVFRAIRRNYKNPRAQMNYISRDYFKISKTAFSLNLKFTTAEAATKIINENFCTP